MQRIWNNWLLIFNYYCIRIKSHVIWFYCMDIIDIYKSVPTQFNKTSLTLTMNEYQYWKRSALFGDIIGIQLVFQFVKKALLHMRWQQPITPFTSSQQVNRYDTKGFRLSLLLFLFAVGFIFKTFIIIIMCWHGIIVS